MVSAFVLLLCILLIIIVLWVFYMIRNFKYWKLRNVTFETPYPIFGNILSVFVFRQSINEKLRTIYNNMKENKFTGMFIMDEPYLLIKDPELIKNVLVKDFKYFNNRTINTNMKADPVASMLLFLSKNSEWYENRKKISPIFTSGKLQLIYNQLLSKCGEDLIDYLNITILNSDIIEIRDLLSKYSMNAVVSTIFGIDANCFTDNDSGFLTLSRNMFNWDSLERTISTTCYFFFPTIVKLLHLKFIHKPSIDFLRQFFWTAIHEREQKNVMRNDLLDILIQLKKSENIDDPHTLEGDKLLAQAAQIIIAGFETITTTISFTLYELAKNKSIQNKLRNEIIEIKQEYNKITCDVLNNLIYLDKVVKEALRMYPSLPFLDRKCERNYKLTDEMDFIVEKGIGVLISIMGLHYDPKYFPDPDKFDPERFDEANIHKIQPFTYIPFGEGPRKCIGFRYGILTAKCGLINILSNYKVDICDKTKIVFYTKGIVISPLGGLYLKFTKI